MPHFHPLVGFVCVFAWIWAASRVSNRSKHMRHLKGRSFMWFLWCSWKRALSAVLNAQVRHWSWVCGMLLRTIVVPPTFCGDLSGLALNTDFGEVAACGPLNVCRAPRFWAAVCWFFALLWPLHTFEWGWNALRSVVLKSHAMHLYNFTGPRFMLLLFAFGDVDTVFSWDSAVPTPIFLTVLGDESSELFCHRLMLGLPLFNFCIFAGGSSSSIAYFLLMNPRNRERTFSRSNSYLSMVLKRVRQRRQILSSSLTITQKSSPTIFANFFVTFSCEVNVSESVRLVALPTMASSHMKHFDLLAWAVANTFWRMTRVTGCVDTETLGRLLILFTALTCEVSRCWIT